MNRKIHFNLAIEHDLLKSLKDRAEKEYTSASELIRKSIKEYLDSSGNQQINPNKISNNNYNNDFCVRVEKNLDDINSKLGNFIKHGKH